MIVEPQPDGSVLAELHACGIETRQYGNLWVHQSLCSHTCIMNDLHQKASLKDGPGSFRNEPSSFQLPR